MNLSLETQDLRSFRDLSLWFFPQDFTLFQRLHARYTCGKVIGSIIRIVRKEQRQWGNQISQKSLNILQNRPLSNVCISQGLGSVSHISELFQSQDKKIEMFFMKSHQTYLMYQDSSCIFTMPKLPITKAQSPTYPHKKNKLNMFSFLTFRNTYISALHTVSMWKQLDKVLFLGNSSDQVTRSCNQDTQENFMQ